MRKLAIGVFLIVFVFLSISLVQGQEKVATSEEVYESAMEHFYKSRYQGAIEGFSKLIQSFPASRLVSYSHYMIGQSFLKLEKKSMKRPFRSLNTISRLIRRETARENRSRD